MSTILVPGPELRMKILNQSFVHFDIKYKHELEEWKRNSSNSTNEYPKYYDFNDVFTLAKKISSFVESK